MLSAITSRLTEYGNQFRELPYWKQALIGTAAATTIYCVYKAENLNSMEIYMKPIYAPNTRRLKAEKVVSCANEVGECCLWDDQKGVLCWIDCPNAKFWTYDPVTKESKSFDLPEPVGSFCFIDNCKEDGLYLFAFLKGPAFYNIYTKKMGKRVFEWEPEKRGSTRPNDGRVDREGRFVFGGMMCFSLGGPVNFVINMWNLFIRKVACRGIYRINKDLSYDMVVEKDIICSNSICFSRDGTTMYYTDTVRGHLENQSFINQLDYYQDAKIPDNQRLFTHNVRVPDGCIVDADGFLWSAQCYPGEVVRINAKNGEVDMVVDVPEKEVTCVTFGGQDLNILFITTLKGFHGIGHLYAVQVPDVKGLKENRFVVQDLQSILSPEL